MAEYFPSAAQTEPPISLREDVESGVGQAWISSRRPDTGLSAAHRYVATLADRTQVFVKGAATAQTARLLRNEYLALQHAPRDLAPRIVAWIDAANRLPVLVTEALAGHWPSSHRGVAWRAGDLNLVIAASRRLAGLTAPQALVSGSAPAAANWLAIAASPADFLAEDFCSDTWLTACAPTLAAAEAKIDRDGDAFVHGDLRSDNICMMEHGPVFVDWSNARRGAAVTDLATFLPVAHLEGGPAPYDILPHAGPWAASQAADLVHRMTQDRAAPAWLRSVFRRLIAINLDWAISCLGLPPRDDFGKDF